MPYRGRLCVTTSHARRHAYLLMPTDNSMQSPSKRKFSATEPVAKKVFVCFPVYCSVASEQLFSAALSCTQTDRTVLLVKMLRSYCFLRKTFVCLISTIRIFVLPSILHQKRADKIWNFKINCTLFLHVIKFWPFVCLSVCHFA